MLTGGKSKVTRRTAPSVRVLNVVKDSEVMAELMGWVVRVAWPFRGARGEGPLAWRQRAFPVDAARCAQASVSTSTHIFVRIGRTCA